MKHGLEIVTLVVSTKNNLQYREGVDGPTPRLFSDSNATEFHAKECCKMQNKRNTLYYVTFEKWYPILVSNL